MTWLNDKMHGGGKRVERNGEEVEVYYLNGVQSKAKSSKSNVGMNLRELTKRFGSVAEKAQSN